MKKLGLSTLNGELRILLTFLYNNAAVYVLIYLQNYIVNQYMPSDQYGLYSYNQTLLMLFVSVYSMDAYGSYLRFLGFYDENKVVKRYAEYY
jgi:O-antigen/teichoic acid export membrane protein